jgi:hypothetical protein
LAASSSTTTHELLFNSRIILFSLFFPFGQATKMAETFFSLLLFSASAVAKQE